MPFGNTMPKDPLRASPPVGQAVPPIPHIPGFPPPPPVPREPMAFMESCLMKTLAGAPVGWALGAGFGVLIASWESMSPPILMPGVPEPPSRPFREEFRSAGVVMRRKATSWSKNFALVTAVYSGMECLMEKGRGVHDIYNHAMAGFATGGVLTIKHGPKAMLGGALGFAAFSLVIETVMSKPPHEIAPPPKR